MQHGIGRALRLAHEGHKDLSAKPLRGFGGAGVLEVIQKKSKSGVATCKRDVELIRRRLNLAIEQDKELRQ